VAAQEIVIGAPRLKAAIEAIVAKGGSEPREADLVAGNLVEANLTGHDSHGVGMIPRYVKSLLEGGLAVNQHPQILLDTGSMLRLDGRAGYGQAIGREAMAFGIERAKQHGTCVVALGNSHHLGRIGHWAEQCLEAGLVSLHFVNVISRPIVAPWGGRDARFGTNPVCIGIPRANGEPFVLDFATSRIAQGKTRVAHNQGKTLEPGIVIDDKGDPTTNPRYSVIPPYGAIMPFGEHKGSGLALACELLGGALAGGGTQHMPDQGKMRVLNGMLSILIDPVALGTARFLAEQAEAFIAREKASPPAAGVERVLIAGDPERARRRERLASGIPVDATTWDEILDAGEKLKLPRDEVRKLAAIA
jgi:hydroxycarboxylate dehydrogenase B